MHDSEDEKRLETEGQLADPAPSLIEVEDADIVIIGPFEHPLKAGFRAFRSRVIDTAIAEAEHALGRPIVAVLLNGLAEDRHSDLEATYRLLHQAPVCIADVTGCDHRALSYLSMRLVLSKRPSMAFDRTRDRLAYPLPVDEIVENAALPHEGTLQAKIRKLVCDALGGESGKFAHPVYDNLPALGVGLFDSPRRSGMEPEFKHYRLAGRRDTNLRLAIALGDIRKVRNVDVWVNPENTRMEMARVFDPSISGTIRHLSANWSHSRFGSRNDDFLCRQLAQRQNGDQVEAGTAILTGCSGDLRRKNKVKAVVHVAAVNVRGNGPGIGYEPVEDIAKCVRNIFKVIDQYNDGWVGRLRSVIIPLMGTAASPDTAANAVGQMVDAIIEHFEQDSSKHSHIEAIALLGYTDEDKRLIQRAFRARGRWLDELHRDRDIL